MISRIEGHEDTAWEWYERLPSFMKQQTDESGFKEIFKASENFGGYDGELKVIVSGEDKGTVTEGHLFCSPDAREGLITATIIYGCENVSKDVLIETPARHKTLRRILLNCGFTDLGLSAYRRRMIETVHYLRTRTN